MNFNIALLSRHWLHLCHRQTSRFSGNADELQMPHTSWWMQTTRRWHNSTLSWCPLSHSDAHMPTLISTLLYHYACLAIQQLFQPPPPPFRVNMHTDVLSITHTHSLSLFGCTHHTSWISIQAVLQCLCVWNPRGCSPEGTESPYTANGIQYAKANPHL